MIPVVLDWIVEVPNRAAGGANEILHHAIFEESGLEWVPHIVAGLHYGTIRGEYEALDLIGRYNPAALVIVVITPLAGTPMANVTPPSPIEVG